MRLATILAITAAAAAGVSLAFVAVQADDAPSTQPAEAATETPESPLGGRADAPTRPEPASEVASNPVPSAALAPAAHLRIRVAQVALEPEALLDPADPAWGRATPASILLSRSPRIYQSEPRDDRPAPALDVSALHARGRLVLRLAWDDATRNAPQAPPTKPTAHGQPERFYKRPTGATSQFPDAAAVMVPDNWNGPAFPSLMMGDAEHTATLFYWNATRGTAALTARGRVTPQPIRGVTVAHRASHADGRWTLTLDLPAQPAGYPLAFAVWDGAHQDRDGLKFFSIWYTLDEGDAR